MKKILPFIVLVALGFSACSNESNNTQNVSATKEKPALPIKVFEVKKEIPTISKEYPAIIKPFEEVDVMARVSGTLEQKYFKEGEFVKKGKLLYKIEQDTYLTNLNMAKANVKKAQANYNKALKDQKRAVSLLKNKAISVQKYDEYIYIYEDAQATLQSAKANLKQSQIQYDYTTVEAPISGIVGIKNNDIGDYVGSNSENSLLVTITAVNPVHIEFSLRKEDISSFLSQIKNKSAKISLDNNGKILENGTIDYISAKLDVNTDTLLLRAKFENNDNNLIIGEFTKIKLDNLVINDVHVIPENALLKTANGNFVYVVEDSIAKIRPVEIGVLLEKGIAIKKGLNIGDKVIVSNIAKVRPNTKVQVLGK